MIGARIAQCQTRDHRRLVRCLRSARTQRLIAALARWARQGAWLELYTRRKDAETLPSYCAGELNRWHARLLRKGKRLKTVGAGRRHRLRIRVKRFRYIIEALTETVPLWGRGKFHHLHRPAKRLQRALGDMRDLRRLADLAGGLPPAGNGKRRRKYPPGYRLQPKRKAARDRYCGVSRPQARRSRLTSISMRFAWNCPGSTCVNFIRPLAL